MIREGGTQVIGPAVPTLDDAYVIPAGTPIHSTKTGTWAPAKRKQTIYPWGVTIAGDWAMVSWAGAGGYWRRVAINSGEFVDYFPS